MESSVYGMLYIVGCWALAKCFQNESLLCQKQPATYLALSYLHPSDIYVNRPFLYPSPSRFLHPWMFNDVPPERTNDQTTWRHFSNEDIMMTTVSEGQSERDSSQRFQTWQMSPLSVIRSQAIACCTCIPAKEEWHKYPCTSRWYWTIASEGTKEKL